MKYFFPIWRYNLSMTVTICYVAHSASWSILITYALWPVGSLGDANLVWLKPFCIYSAPAPTFWLKKRFNKNITILDWYLTILVWSAPDLDHSREAGCGQVLSQQTDPNFYLKICYVSSFFSASSTSWSWRRRWARERDRRTKWRWLACQGRRPVVHPHSDPLGEL